MNKRYVTLCCLILTLVGAKPGWARPIVGNPQAGALKKWMCAGCHGIKDYRTAYPKVYDVPKLGGQHAAYIIQALEEYKSGARSFPDMRAIASSLSQQDIADLAAYYGGKK